MTIKITAAVAAASLILAAAPAFAAENGTTLAGPAQGSKADGSSSMAHPSAESGANGGGAMTGHADAPATGTMSGGSTATGGNVGGPAGRN